MTIARVDDLVAAFSFGYLLSFRFQWGFCLQVLVRYWSFGFDGVLGLDQ
jgi:hypothetical protein